MERGEENVRILYCVSLGFVKIFHSTFHLTTSPLHISPQKFLWLEVIFKLNNSSSCIQVWFQNRRAKCRKHESQIQKSTCSHFQLQFLSKHLISAGLMMSSGPIESSRISSFLAGVSSAPSPRLLSSSTPGPSDLRSGSSFPSSLLSSSSSPYYSPDPALLAAAQHYSSANQGSLSFSYRQLIQFTNNDPPLHSTSSGGSCSSCCISVCVWTALLSTVNTSSSILNLCFIRWKVQLE